MPDADAQISQFQNYLNHLPDVYQKELVNPYTRAFEIAHKGFNDVIEEQAKKNAALMEFMLTAFSLAGGSLLTRVFAKSALKSVAKDVAINAICRAELKRTFETAALIEKSPVASFILDKLWDTGEEYLGDKTKAMLTEDAANFKALESFETSPLKARTVIQDFVLDAKIKAWNATEDLLQSRKSDTEKITALNKLRGSRFCRGPLVKIDEKQLAKDIELTWWMTFLLSRDRLVSVSGVSRVKEESIDVNPTAKSYPKGGPATVKVDSRGNNRIREVRQHVEYDHFLIGEFGLADRLNRVYKERTGKHILAPLGSKVWGSEGRRTTVTWDGLLRAELMLQQIGFENHWRHLPEYVQ